MEKFIRMLTRREIVGDREEAISMINCMKEEIEAVEEVRDVLEIHDLDLDDAIDFLLLF
jgi:hypothetical protein